MTVLASTWPPCAARRSKVPAWACSAWKNGPRWREAAWNSIRFLDKEPRFTRGSRCAGRRPMTQSRPMSSPDHPVRVVLADDHPIVRAGIRAELEKIPGTLVVGEAADGREALDLVRTVSPAVVFMDISMRGLNG